MARKKQRSGVLDFETDPFKYERIPAPFAGCLYFADNDNAVVWGDNAAETLAGIIGDLPTCNLYAHNGGKFDFWFLLPYAERDEIKIINGRIAKMRIGAVTLIDSFLLMPFALDQYKKDKIDYELFERDVREQHKEEIIRYMVADCRYTLELLTTFHDLLGKKLTIGGAAMSRIKQVIAVEQQNAAHDAKFRPYYYGGRVESFVTGQIGGTIHCLDLNSAYSSAMLLEHPHGEHYRRVDQFPEGGAWFATINATSRGALPLRLETGELLFPNDDLPRVYRVTGHEIRAGLDTGTLDVHHIIDVMVPKKTINFKKFVLPTYANKKLAAAAKNVAHVLVWKYNLNAGYGKFASNPDKFYDWELAEVGVNPNFSASKRNRGRQPITRPLKWYSDVMGVALWRRPAGDAEKSRGYHDVATAASITGANRAVMWRGLCAVDRPYYCDTDGIICGGPGDLPLDPTELGAWKTEMRGNKAYFGGKKMYAVVDTIGKKYKKASKGARLSIGEIIAISRGRSIIWNNAAPTFSLSRGANFVKRVIKRKRT